MKCLLSLTVPVLVVGLFFAGSGCRRQTTEAASSPGQPTAAAIDRVVAGKPVRRTLKLVTTQPGRIEAFEEAPLFSKLAGFVQEVRVDIGDSVKKDQVLVKLSIPEMLDEVKQMEALVAQADAEGRQADAAVKASEAMVGTAEAKVAQATAGIGRAVGEYERWKAEHARLTELAAKGSVTQKLVDETLNQLRSADAARQEATANVKSAGASLRAAKANVQKSQADLVAAGARRKVAGANLAYAKTMLAYAEIKAPFNGVITQRNVDTGHYVHPVTGGATEPLLVVAQTEQVRVFVDVPEMEAPLVDAGEKPDSAVIHVQSLGETGIDGKVTRTSWSLDKSNRSLRAEIDLPNKEGKLRPGMYAKVDILLDQRDNVLTLPLTAIVREGGETYCYSIASGKIDRKKIELGMRSGPEVEVRSGVNADQLIVLARADSLIQGQSVEVIAPQQ
jgi:RND family efflux transporter MFP subunit